MSAKIHNSPAAFRFIFITVLLDMLALGIIVATVFGAIAYEVARRRRAA
jgi:hypothetical protein